jgi:iron complex outermembrane recepter protein
VSLACLRVLNDRLCTVPPANFLAARWARLTVMIIMKSTIFVLLPLACVTGAAFSQTAEKTVAGQYDLPAVVVKSNRLLDGKVVAPPSATLITRTEIQNSGYTSLAEVIQKLGFVNTRSGLVGSRDASFDLRGFGGSSPDSNVAVIVDGIRYSEKELATARISSIPLSAVAQIEIMRGGASVAYGDGASGGVIRITTVQPQANAPLSGTGAVSVGSYNLLETTLGLRGGAGSIGFTLDITESASEGYRDRSAEDFGSALAGLSWMGDKVLAGVKFGTESSDVQFPGSLSLVQFKANPRQARPTPSNVGDFSFFKRDLTSVYLRSRNMPFDYGVDVSRRDQSRTFKDGNPRGQRDLVQDQLSVFVSDNMEGLGGVHQLTLGVALEEARLDSVGVFSFGTFVAKGQQKSRALHLGDDLVVSDTLRVNLGYRLESIDQFRFDTDDSGFNVPADRETRRNIDLEAYELGFSRVLTDSLTGFAKFNKGFRVPNIDENDPTSRPSPATFLNPQLSKELEVGIRRRAGETEQVLRLFKIMLDDEIANVNFTNINLDKTQRLGVEMEHSTPVTDRVDLRAAYTYTDSEFRTGELRGTRVPLVPAHRALLGLGYEISDRFDSEILITAQSDQRLGGDLDAPNEEGKVPGYALADLAFKYRFEQMKLIFSVNNLFDRQYYSQGFYNAFAIFSGVEPVGVYPDPGRNFKLTAQFDF